MANEQLVIDSMAKDIYKLAAGEKINAFGDRYIQYTPDGKFVDKNFKKIAAGSNYVSAGDDFQWSLTLYDERSEPKWI